MAEKENQFQGVVESLLRGMDGVLSTKTVVGEATQIGDTIILPLIFPVLMMLIIQLLPMIFTSSGAVLFFTQGEYGTQTISYWIFDRVRTRNDLNYSTTVSFFFSLLTLPISLFAYWLMNKVPAVEY